ncbi:MAG TPA: DUF3313 domain-containing protein [Myxococcota bacterium]|nr:DUF3313 domain-containing protein [Myxococcota bacterium]
MRAPLRRLCVALAMALWLGCAAGAHSSAPSAAEASPFGPSGFLGDYSALRPGGKNRARLVYLDANADFSGYERVIIEPVVVWKSDDERFAGISPAKREALAREFQAELERAFAQEFAIAGGDAGAGTLRARNALTAAIAAPGSSDPERLQYVEVELELVDAVTHQRLAAAVDSKGARPSSAHGAPQALEAKAAFEEWADRVAARLAALRDVDRQPR